MMTHQDLQHFAEQWIANWNRHDLEAILGHFAEDAVFISPRAQTVTGQARIQGREALRQYWTKALAAVPDLQFDLESATCDDAGQTLVVHYIARLGGRSVRACEMMRFENGRQIYGEAYYGAPA